MSELRDINTELQEKKVRIEKYKPAIVRKQASIVKSYIVAF